MRKLILEQKQEGQERKQAEPRGLPKTNKTVLTWVKVHGSSSLSSPGSLKGFRNTAGKHPPYQELLKECTCLIRKDKAKRVRTILTLKSCSPAEEEANLFHMIPCKTKTTCRIYKRQILSTESKALLELFASVTCNSARNFLNYQ